MNPLNPSDSAKVGKVQGIPIYGGDYWEIGLSNANLALMGVIPTLSK